MDNAKSGRVTDALLNWETVKYFNNERLETENLQVAIQDYQVVEYKLLASLAALNVIQSAVIFSGLVAGLLVCTKVRTSGASKLLAQDKHTTTTTEYHKMLVRDVPGIGLPA